MKINIIYFSQTGNTHKVAVTLEEALKGEGHSVRGIQLKTSTLDDFIDCDVVGVGTPCFSSQAPTPVKEFLKKLPQLKQKRAFVFATTGGAPGKVLYDLARILRSKGADIIGGFMVRGQTSHPAPCLSGLYPGRPHVEDLTCARNFALALSDHIKKHSNSLIREGRPGELNLRLGFYQFIALISRDGLLRMLLPKPQPKLDRCTKCQWCLNECPMGNISFTPFPKLDKKCIRCYRCATGCPQKAMHTNWLFGNLVVFALYNKVFQRWFGDLESGE